MSEDLGLRPSNSSLVLWQVPFRSAAIGLLLILLIVAVSQLAFINGDPPYWVEEAYIVDGGWWASSARAKVFFGDYFSGEFGISYLLEPAYTWALKTIYSYWGVGLPQTRILSAISNIIVVVIIAVVVWRMGGRTEAIVATVFLGLSPFFWSQGRLGLPEPMQAVFIVGSFALWFLTRHSIAGAIGSGMAMALAIAVKPTALLMGLFPVTLAGLAVYLVERTKQSADLEASSRRHTLFRAVLAFSALFLGLGILFFAHLRPNWEILRLPFSTEKGIYGMDWRQVLTIPGRVLVSKEIDGESGFSPVIWRVAKWSPAIIVGAWFYFLRLLLQCRAGIKRTLKALGVLEIASVTWVLGTWLAICAYPGQPDYRYVPMIPGLAVLGSIFCTRNLTWVNRATLSTSTQVRRPGKLFSFCLWAVLLFPLFLVLKPWVARFVMTRGRNFPLGDTPGIEYGSAGTLFMAAWFVILVVVAGFRKKGIQVGSFFLGRFATIVFPVLLLFQCWSIGYYFANVETTMVDRQADLANYVKEDGIVVGRMAETLFLSLRVRTARRLSPDSPPLQMFESPAILDMEDGLQPQYAVIPSHFNFRTYKPYGAIFKDLVMEGYETIYRFDVGPRRKGIPRFKFELFRRVPPELAKH